MRESIFQPMPLAEIETQAASYGCSVVIAAANELQFECLTMRLHGTFFASFTIQS